MHFDLKSGRRKGHQVATFGVECHLDMIVSGELLQQLGHDRIAGPRSGFPLAVFYSLSDEAAPKAKGIKRVCIPHRSTKSPERKREQRKCWFRNGQKWRTGSEGRINVVKRRRNLARCRSRASPG